MLKESAGGSIHIDHLNVHLLPSPQIFLTGLTFTSEKPGTQASLQVKKVELAFGWESLWQRKVVLTRGVIQEPELTIQLPFLRESTEPEEWNFPAIQELAIHDGRFHLVKESGTGTPMRLTWGGIQLAVARMKEGGATLIELVAQAPEQENPFSLALKGTLTFIDRTETASAEAIPGGISPFHLRGGVEFSQVPLGRWMSFLSDDTPEIPYTNMNIQSEYAFTLQPDTSILALPNFQISLDEWMLSGHSRITGLQTDSPHFLLSGSTTPITIERLKNFLPPAWLPVEVRNFLADRQVDGTLELLTGSVQGTVNRQDPLVAEGVLRLEEGRLLTAPDHPPITQLSGIVGFDSQQVRIRDARGTVAPFTVSTQEATLHIQDVGLDVSIPSFHVSDHDWTLTGQASFTHFDKASPTLAISGSAPPISIQRLVGLLPEAWLPPPIRTVLVDRQVAGIMELRTGTVKWPMNGDDPVAADGVIRLEQGHILIDPNHPPLTHLAGSVVFDSNLVRILDAQGRIESSDLGIKEATLELNDSEVLVDLHGEGNVPVLDIVQALLRDPRSRDLAHSLVGYRDIQGHIRIATHMTGPLSHPDQLRILQGDLALDHVNVFLKKDWLPLTGIMGHLTFDHRRLAIQRLKGQLGNSPLEVKGQWDFKNVTGSSNLTVQSTIATSDLLTLFPDLSNTFSIFSGSLGSTLTLSGTTSALSYGLHVDLSDWELASSGIATKPAHLPGTFDATGRIHDLHKLILTKGELSLPPFKLDVGGSLTMETPPHFRIGLRTESGTGALLPEGMIVGDERLGLSTLAINLALQGRNQDWTTWNMQGTVESTDRVRLSNTSRADLGSKNFRLTWRQKDQNAKVDLSLSNLLLETVFPADPTPRFTGSLTLQTTMALNLQHPDWTQRLMNGKGDIRLTDGHILASPVLSKILGLLNVPNLLMGKIDLLKNGFPVDTLTGTFSVEDALVTTNDLALKSPVMTLAAAGTHDLRTDQLNAIVTASPFGAYSSLLKSIPLFGTLVKGERKGLTTALFEVKGPRTDPEVTYLPLQSVTGGILGLAKFPLDVLKNVLTLPLPDKKSTLSEEPVN